MLITGRPGPIPLILPSPESNPINKRTARMNGNLRLFDDSSSVPSEEKKTRKPRSWSERDPEELDGVGLVYYHFERIRMGLAPYSKQYYDTAMSGNFGKAGKFIKQALNRGYSLARFIPGIIAYYEDEGDFVKGHAVDKWATQIDRYDRLAQEQAKERRKTHYVDEKKLEDEIQKELRRFQDGLGANRTD